MWEENQYHLLWVKDNPKDKQIQYIVTKGMFISS